MIVDLMKEHQRKRNGYLLRFLLHHGLRVPPTRWQRARWAARALGRRLADAWAVLLGRAEVCE